MLSVTAFNKHSIRQNYTTVQLIIDTMTTSKSDFFPYNDMPVIVCAVYVVAQLNPKLYSLVNRLLLTRTSNAASCMGGWLYLIKHVL